MSYVAKYRKYYPAETRDEVWCDVPMEEGYCMISAAMALDGWLQFSGVGIADGGYIKQEADKLMKK